MIISLKFAIALAVVCRCKKYPSMELRGLFQYLVNQLKKGNGIELVLLQVFSDMSHCAFMMYLLVPFLTLRSSVFGIGTYPANGKCSIHREHDGGTARCHGREWHSPISGYFFWDNSKQQGGLKSFLSINSLMQNLKKFSNSLAIRVIMFGKNNQLLQFYISNGLIHNGAKSEHFCLITWPSLTETVLFYCSFLSSDNSNTTLPLYARMQFYWDLATF